MKFTKTVTSAILAMAGIAAAFPAMTRSGPIIEIAKRDAEAYRDRKAAYYPGLMGPQADEFEAVEDVEVLEKREAYRDRKAAYYPGLMGPNVDES